MLGLYFSVICIWILNRAQASEFPIYHPPFDPSLEGKPFPLDLDYRQSLDLPPSKFAELSGDFTSDFVIATGATADHFEESIDCIASVQEHLPRRKLLYFDLGLTAKQRNLLLPDGGAEADRIICNVDYRTFNFSRYPEHVKDLYVYSWKFLIIKEVLEEFGAVFWMDSSVRLNSGNFMYELKLHLEKSRGIALFSRTKHSNYAVTHESVYQFLPVDVEVQKQAEQWEGGNLLIYNTRELYENVLQWMYYCVLVPECIAPVRSRSCRFGANRWTIKGQCHRYDQATINLLLSNWFGNKTDTYAYTRRAISRVVRTPTHFYKIQWCQPLPAINEAKREHKNAENAKFLPRTEL